MNSLAKMTVLPYASVLRVQVSEGVRFKVSEYPTVVRLPWSNGPLRLTKTDALPVAGTMIELIRAVPDKKLVPISSAKVSVGGTSWR